MITFLDNKDELGKLLNEACNDLMIKIKNLPIDNLSIEPFYKEYFIRCHFTRQIFSLKTSAKLLYNAINATQKHYKDIVLLDYGAGVGTLYLLAKMIGLRKVVYNDLLPEFVNAAQVIDTALGIEMDEYIEGGTELTCKQLQVKNIQCDIITSRNVLEHIYDLGDFFKTMYEYQPTAILYNSTTANWRNPAAHLQHLNLHRRGRAIIFPMKMKIVKDMIPDIKEKEAHELTTILLQYGGDEFEKAIEEYKQHKTMPANKNDYTNFCDDTGNWGEPPADLPGI